MTLLLIVILRRWLQLCPTKMGSLLSTLSKNMGISGWRIGYIISSEDVIQAVLKVNQHLITCAPTILLQYCTKYFEELFL